MQDIRRRFSKTAAGGEIDALDPGGFGAITITKSVTLNGTTGAGFASVLVSGTNGINVAACASDTVILRNLEVQGIGSGLNGISITGGKSVVIENVLVTGMTQRGISDTRNSASFLLFITDTTVRNNANGIVLAPGAAGAINAVLDHVRIVSNTGVGFSASGQSFVAIKDTTAGMNGTGFIVRSAPADVSLENCAAFNNTTGVRVAAAGTTIRLSNCAIFENGTGVLNNGGSLLSFGNNKFGGNTAGNTGVTAVAPGPQ